MKYNIGVVNWNSGDGLSDAIHKTIQNIGHKSIHFIYNQPVPSEIDIVFSFAPYGKFLVLANNISNLSSNRPMFIHWDTEMQVNPAIPVNLMFTIAKWRSLFGRILLSQYNLAKSPLRYLDRFYRLQCLGDYSYAYEQGWLDILFEFSEYFTNYLNKIGIPAIFIPWGAHPDWYENLGVKRDIDVLWMGSWRTRKRRNTFNQLKSKLEPLGVKFFIADNEVHPFIYGKLRTELLNRSKITLNLSTTWYVSNFDHRFGMAAGNSSLVVSDPITLPHNPYIITGKHYIAPPVDHLADTILYYLNNEEERRWITDNAYNLVTSQLTLENSIRSILSHIDSHRKKEI